MKASKLILGHGASNFSSGQFTYKNNNNNNKKKETKKKEKIKIKKRKLFVTVRSGLFSMRVNNCSCVQIDKEI